MNLVTKSFRLLGRSANTNSFGLRNHIFLARDGHAFEAARSDGSHHQRQFEDGKDYDFDINPDAIYGGIPANLSRDGFEIPHALPAPPPAVLKKIFGRKPVAVAVI